MPFVHCCHFMSTSPPPPPLIFREGSDCSWPSYLYSLFTNPFRLGWQHYTAHASLMSNKDPFLVDAFNQTKKRQTSGRQNLRLQNPPKIFHRNYIKLKIHGRLEGKQCRARWSGSLLWVASSRSTLFANFIIFFFCAFKGYYYVLIWSKIIIKYLEGILRSRIKNYRIF